MSALIAIESHVRCKRLCISWRILAGSVDRDRWSRWHRSPSMGERNPCKVHQTRTCWVARASLLRLTATTGDDDDGDVSVTRRVMSRLSTAPQSDAAHLRQKEKGRGLFSSRVVSENRTRVNKTASYRIDTWTGRPDLIQAQRLSWLRGIRRGEKEKALSTSAPTSLVNQFYDG